jgi:hypothetical protein
MLEKTMSTRMKQQIPDWLKRHLLQEPVMSEHPKMMSTMMKQQMLHWPNMKGDFRTLLVHLPTQTFRKDKDKKARSLHDMTKSNS